jgi:hypothetical protein
MMPLRICHLSMTGAVLRVPAPSICKGRAFCISPGATAKGPIRIYGRGPHDFVPLPR